MDSTRCGTLPTTARRVIIVRNPHAGAVSTVGPVERLMRDLARRELDPHLITDANELEDTAARWHAAGQLRAVVAAGGDGTAGLVANRIASDIPMTLLPLGTENLLARYLLLSADTASLAHVIRNGRTIQMDAGAVRVGDAPAKLFLLMIGCGFDAEVIRRLHERRRGHITHLSYFKPILSTMREFAYPEMKVTYTSTQSQQERSISAHWVFVFNTPSYARSLPICPTADPTDGQLDIVAFNGGSTWHGFGHLFAVLQRRHHRQVGVEMGRAERIRIEAIGPTPFQADGDPGGVLPIEIETQAARLTMVVPERWRPEL